MKQYLLFAGREGSDLKGVQALVGGFDSFAEAFVSLVDHQTPAQWWHVLDTHTGEVVERRHLKVHNGMMGFERSDWVIGQPSHSGAGIALAPVFTAPSSTVSPLPSKAATGPGPEASLRLAVVGAVKSSVAKANG